MRSWMTPYLRAAEDGGSCVGENWALLKYLEATDRISREDGADISVCQTKMRDEIGYGDAKLKVGLITMMFSPLLVEHHCISQQQLDYFVSFGNRADVVLAHSHAHKIAMVESGIAEEKIEVVEGAATTSCVPISDEKGRCRTRGVGLPPERPHTVGFAALPIIIKRPWIAAHAAYAAKAQYMFAGGGIRRGMMPMFYDRLGVLVLPSLAESFGLVVVEAIARGVPVVVTETCGVAPYVEETGAGIVTSTDENDICRATIEVLDNKRYANAAWLTPNPRHPQERAAEIVCVCEKRLKQMEDDHGLG